MASVDDLNAWLQAPAAALPPRPPSALWRRSLPWVGALAAVAGLAIIAAASWLSWRRVPAEWRIQLNALVVVDDHGRELWRKTFDYPLEDYQRLSASHLNMGWLGDLDGDGESEVLFLAHPRAEGNPMVYCYSRSGVERWRFQPGQAARGFTEEYLPPYHPENLLVFRVRGAVRIAVASVHHTWFPSQIALLSGDGKLLDEYWHAGHLPFLAVTEPSPVGKQLLFAGGIANGYKRAALVALDLERFGGVSSEHDPKYQFPGAPAREVVRVLFPRTCINRVKEPYNGVMSLQVTPTELVVGVREETGQPAVVVHRFGTDGQYRGAGLSSQFVARHNELEHTKLLDHHLDSERETADSAKLEWLTGAPALSTPRLAAANR